MKIPKKSALEPPPLTLPENLDFDPDAWDKFEALVKAATRPKAERESAKADPRPLSGQKKINRPL
jgi:hypothetical protein